jgi:hypothetical protein
MASPGFKLGWMAAREIGEFFAQTLSEEYDDEAAWIEGITRGCCPQGVSTHPMRISFLTHQR